MYVHVRSMYMLFPAKTSVRPKHGSAICEVPLTVGSAICSATVPATHTAFSLLVVGGELALSSGHQETLYMTLLI